MSAERVKEILAAHADALVTDGAASPALDELPERQEEARALMEIAERTHQALQPMPLPPAFRARLHDSLRMAARHQQTRASFDVRRNEPAWRWLIGAAALGTAAGVIAVVIRSRAQAHRAAAYRRD